MIIETPLDTITCYFEQIDVSGLALVNLAMKEGFKVRELEYFKVVPAGDSEQSISYEFRAGDLVLKIDEEGDRLVGTYQNNLVLDINKLGITYNQKPVKVNDRRVIKLIRTLAKSY